MQNRTVVWTACWISSQIVGDAKVSPPAPYFRKEFKLEGEVDQAVLHVTALGLYECEINGKRVGDEVFAPGWTEYRKRVYFRSFDVTGQLIGGINAVGAILGDGWYCGRVAEKERQFYGKRPQLLMQLEITMKDGSRQSIATDASWQTTPGPILGSDIMAGESYDARRELGAWSVGGYDAGAWDAATLAPDPGIVIERSPGPPVRRHETLAGTEIRSQTNPVNRRIFDFAQNLTGRVRIAVQGNAGIALTVRHAEVLDDQGAIYTENLRGAKCTDVYVTKGNGPEIWEPRFTFHGFRYAEVTWEGEAAGIAISKIEGIVLHSDLPVTGTFSCSHPLLNQLEHNILWGQKSNFLEIPTDCPQRDERLGWTGDAQAFIRTAAFHMDVSGFFHRWHATMRDDQGLDGSIPPVIPNTDSFGNAADGGPAWADAALICPWAIYRHYDDLDILRDNYDCMGSYMDYLAKNKVRNYIRCHPDVDEWGGFGDWLALDGGGRVDGITPKDLIGTAFYAHNADIMARAAELLGKQADVKAYSELHGRIVEAFRRRYVTPDGLLASGTQTSYVLALHFDLLPKESRAGAATELVRNIKRKEMHLGTGFVGTPYLLHVLEAHGYLDVAYALLEQESYPSWLFPVKNGATTIWERWDGWTPDKGFQDKGMNSFNHYAYGAVGDWMVSTVAGLEMAAPGYRNILFKPRPGGTITWAEARLLTPFGEAAIRWELKDGALYLDLLVPAGGEATLSLPEGWKTDSSVVPPGTHRLVAKRTA
jgi:alpha-L-rhamnosidase